MLRGGRFANQAGFRCGCRFGGRSRWCRRGGIRVRGLLVLAGQESAQVLFGRQSAVPKQIKRLKYIGKYAFLDTSLFSWILQ